MQLGFKSLIASFNPYRTLRARLGWIIFATAIALSLLTSSVINQTVTAQLEASAGNALFQLAYQVSDKLDRGIFERDREIQIFTTLNVIQDPTVSEQEKRSLLESLQKSYPLYSWIGLTNPKGEVLVSTGRLLENKTVAQRPWFQNAKTRPYVGDVHEALLLSQLLPKAPNDEPLRFIDVAAPVFNAQSQFLGVLGAHLSWSWASEVRDSLILPREQKAQIEAFIFDTKGKLLLGSASTPADTFLPSTDGKNYRIERWADGKIYLTGIARSLGYLQYPGLGWSVVARQPIEVAFAPVRHIQQQILILSLGLALMAALAGWIIAHYLTRSLLKISAAADRLRQGHSARLPILTGQDEVARLSRSLNYLVQNLLEKEQRYRYIFETVGVSIWEEDFSQVGSAIAQLKAQGVDDFEQYFSQHPEFVQQLATQVHVLDINPATLSLLQAQNKPQVLDALAIFSPASLATFTQELIALANEVPYFSGEIVLKTLSGESRTVLVAITFPHTQPLDRVLVTMTDITRRKQAEADLQQLNATLEQRVEARTLQLKEINQELESFTYSVSHDLRAPLRVMQGFSQALEEDYGDRLDETAQSYLDSIKGSAVQMDELISDLLTYSRLSRTQIQNQLTDVNHAIDIVLHQLSPQIQKQNAIVTVPPDIPLVLAHRSTLIQVMTNLISNAIKFVKPGVQPRITVRFQQTQDWLELWIVDNGIGIAPKHQERIFKVFERLHGSETYEGTGIGLAIVRKGIDRMGGRVGVQSEFGAGSQFWIALPAVSSDRGQLHDSSLHSTDR
jgi:signal transduction histidine kinase/HAMP domain-containing protein